MTREQAIAVLTVILNRGDQPVSLGYFEMGPVADRLFTAIGTTFDAQMPHRLLDGNPRTILNAAEVTKMHRDGKSPAEIVAEVIHRMPGYVQAV